MTNNEAIKIIENMVETLAYYDDIVLYDYEEDAIEQLIKTAKAYDALIASDKHYTYEDLINVAMREK